MLPKCHKCQSGILLPLSDYGEHGSSLLVKAWVCSSPSCGFQIRVSKGKPEYHAKTPYNTERR